MKRSYIFSLAFTLLIILTAAVLLYGYNSLLNSPDPTGEQSRIFTDASGDLQAWNEEDTTEPLPEEAHKPTAPMLRDEPGHQPTVVLDAGHGFGDVGCAGPQTDLGDYEYELTLDMVKTLKAKLEAEGIRVLLTHDGTDFPTTDELIALCEEHGVYYDTSKSTWQDNDIFSPYERTIYMNVLDAMYGVDFALSVHVNANAESSELNGFDLDYCAQNYWSTESKVFAEALREALKKTYVGRNLYYYEDSWDDAFVVTKYNSMPSALLETGYYTNPEDCALLRNKQWRDDLMQVTADTISEVLKNE